MVGKVVGIGEADPGLGLRFGGAGDGDEVHVIVFLGPVAVHQIAVRAADPLDGRNVQFHGAHRPLNRSGAALDRQGWRQAGLVAASDRDTALRRYYDINGVPAPHGGAW